MISTTRVIFGVIGGLLLFVIFIFVLAIGKPIIVVPNGPGYTGWEALQMFGWVLASSEVVLAYRAVPAIFVPLEKRSKGSLWFGIAWLAGLGIAPLFVFMPRLFPWQPGLDSFGSVVVPGIIFVLLWCLLVHAIWRSTQELNRRTKAPMP